MMNRVVIQFKKLNHTCIDKILREKLNYILYPYLEGEEIFCFEGWNFMRRFGKSPSLEREAQRLAFEIGEYGFVSNVRFSYDRESDRYRIVVIGRETLDPFAGGIIDEGWNTEYDLEHLRINFENDRVAFDPKPLKRYLDEDRRAVLDAYKRDTMHLRIPKTFDVYSGYSKDGRLRTIVHWQDGVKTSVYLQNEDFDDIYIAIAYCYVKRKFGNLSHFKRIVERNTKGVTGVAKRFIYGGDSTLLVNMYNTYDQVALYLAISYLGDTDQWLTDEDIKRLEDSVNE